MTTRVQDRLNAYQESIRQSSVRVRPSAKQRAIGKLDASATDVQTYEKSAYGAKPVAKPDVAELDESKKDLEKFEKASHQPKQANQPVVGTLQETDTDLEQFQRASHIPRPVQRPTVQPLAESDTENFENSPTQSSKEYVVKQPQKMALLNLLIQEEKFRGMKPSEKKPKLCYNGLQHRYLKSIHLLRPDHSNSEVIHDEMSRAERRNARKERQLQIQRNDRFTELKVAWNKYDSVAEDKPAFPKQSDKEVSEAIEFVELDVEEEWEEYFEKFLTDDENSSEDVDESVIVKNMIRESKGLKAESQQRRRRRGKARKEERIRHEKVGGSIRAKRPEHASFEFGIDSDHSHGKSRDSDKSSDSDPDNQNSDCSKGSDDIGGAATDKNKNLPPLSPVKHAVKRLNQLSPENSAGRAMVPPEPLYDCSKESMQSPKCDRDHSNSIQSPSRSSVEYADFKAGLSESPVSTDEDSSDYSDDSSTENKSSPCRPIHKRIAHLSFEGGISEPPLVEVTDELEAKARENIKNLLDREELRVGGAKPEKTEDTFESIRRRYMMAVKLLEPEKIKTVGKVSLESWEQGKIVRYEQAVKQKRFAEIRDAWEKYALIAQDFLLEPVPEDGELDEQIRKVESKVEKKWIDYAKHVVKEHDQVKAQSSEGGSISNSDDDTDDDTDDEEVGMWRAEARRLKADARERGKRQDFAEMWRKEIEGLKLQPKAEKSNTMAKGKSPSDTSHDGETTRIKQEVEENTDERVEALDSKRDEYEKYLKSVLSVDKELQEKGDILSWYKNKDSEETKTTIETWGVDSCSKDLLEGKEITILKDKDSKETKTTIETWGVESCSKDLLEDKEITILGEEHDQNKSAERKREAKQEAENTIKANKAKSKEKRKKKKNKKKKNKEKGKSVKGILSTSGDSHSDDNSEHDIEEEITDDEIPPQPTRNPDGKPWRTNLKFWKNPPKQNKAWEWNKQIIIKVPKKSNCWRKTRNGQIVDNAPFAWSKVSGNFEAIVKISGDFSSTYDRAGIMLRQNRSHWVMAGVEYVNDKLNFSTCVTHGHTDWSLIPLPEVSPKTAVYICMKRIGATFEAFYSIDGQGWTQSRQGHITTDDLQVGICATCPQGKGYQVTFDSFFVNPLAKEA